MGDELKEDYFAVAWESAVDDGLVDESKQSDFFIKFVEDVSLG